MEHIDKIPFMPEDLERFRAEFNRAAGYDLQLTNEEVWTYALRLVRFAVMVTEKRD